MVLFLSLGDCKCTNACICTFMSRAAHLWCKMRSSHEKLGFFPIINFLPTVYDIPFLIFFKEKKMKERERMS